jgi:hypothetical protein
VADAELEAERLAILAEERMLLEAQKRLRLTPEDREAHAAHLERLRAHTERVRACQAALRERQDT